MKASVIANRDYTISKIDDRVYGAFLEHLGRAVYEGIYEPDHPTADKDGMRGDVVDVRRSNERGRERVHHPLVPTHESTERAPPGFATRPCGDDEIAIGQSDFGTSHSGLHTYIVDPVPNFVAHRLCGPLATSPRVP